MEPAIAFLPYIWLEWNCLGHDEVFKGATQGNSDEQQRGREDRSRCSRREEKDKALAVGLREQFFPSKNPM